MRVEDFRLLGADVLFGFVAQRGNLLSGLRHRICHALFFGLGIRNRGLCNRQISLPDDERLRPRQALGNADRLDFQHSFPSSTLMCLCFPVIPYNFTTLIVRYIVVFVKCI